MPIAFGLPGVSGDPEVILYCANRLAGVYRNSLEWKLDFRRIEVTRQPERLRVISETLSDNFVRELEAFNVSVRDSLARMIAAAQAGEDAHIPVILTMSVPDTSAFHAELDRLKMLVNSGELIWD